jgi:hypothetical protein
VKVGEKEGEWFETTNGVIHGCPLSPVLLPGRRGRNVKESASGGGGGALWCGWNLVSAVIVAKSEREMKEMMTSLGKYVRKKKLEKAGSEC